MKRLAHRRSPRQLPSTRPGFKRAGLPLLLAGAIGALTLHGCQDGRPTATVDASGIAPNLALAPAAAPIVNGTGKWAAPFAWGGSNPGVGIHMHVLPNGKVLTFGHSGAPAVWDPATGAFTTVPSPSLVFCSGHAWLPDGRLLIMGGHDDALGDEYGQRTSNIFDYNTQTWITQPAMAYGRWYPTSTTLPNGDILTTGGTDSVRGQMPYPEVRSGSTTRILTGAKYDFAEATAAYYPRMFVAPNGKVFYAGEEQQSRWLDVAGNGSWTTGPLSNYGRRDYGTAVEYEPGKILIVGGGYAPPTATAETIDLNAASPTWTYTGDMANPRRQLNSTLLADGTVMVNGGTSITGFTEEAGAVSAAERWNPATGIWSTMASQQVIRVYHSTAVLLPDGRVLTAGSGEGSNATAQYTAEIFSPPYLFDATGKLASRPQITSIPSSVGYGQSFSLGFNKANNISRVNLVRLSSVTHAFNESQLFLTLPFTVAKGNKLTVTAPANGRLAPPGPYMLFLLDENGVPSLAKIVRIG